MTPLLVHDRTCTSCVQLDHTADVALLASGPDVPRALAALVRGTVDVLTEDAPLEPTEARHVTIDAVDAADAIVALVNDVIFAAITDGFLTAELADVRFEDRGPYDMALSALLWGQPRSKHVIRDELKAATHHDFEVRHEPDGAGQTRTHIQLIIDV